MGQFLSIGIVTRLGILKKEMEKGRIEPAEVFELIENTLHYPIDIYEVTENEDAIFLTLKNDIITSELIPFLEKFYPIMYRDKNDCIFVSDIINKLKNTPPVEWMNIAENDPHYFFQMDKYAENDRLYFDKDFKPRINVRYKCISLSTEGKIVMEEYGRQFNFMKYCMNEAFKAFSIAGALRVYITG